ncbi:Putative Zinc finger C2H2-type [Septoria linicola]|uniref:Zinc finger C2H2-type n=1 Tax=Septoria linicola TaxID=215465 RepID=A0A9Q9EF94_9PEZI|nr:Putative Zinc finger C2H2-type [Septoria linicola]
MAFRSREDQLAASEEVHSFPQPGSVLFAHPAEVTHWCHSIYPDTYPLTPPDTASDCAPSDCPDMYDSSWSQPSMPEESWPSGSAPDHGDMLQSAGRQWTAQGAPMPRQDSHSFDASSWVHVPQGPVELGLSPVLSQESQTAHSLHAVPEPDLPLLPPGLDLSFIGEPTHWNASGAMYVPPSQDLYTGMISSHEALQAGPQVHGSYPCSTVSQPVIYGPHPPMYAYQDGPAHQSRRAVSDPSCSPARRLLPRVEDPIMSMPQSHGEYYPVQPRVSGAIGEPSYVSNARSVPMDARLSRTSRDHGLPTPPPRPDTVSPAMMQGPSFASEDFSTFVRYDQEDHAPSAHTSLVHGEAPASTHLSVQRQELTPTLSRTDSNGSVPQKATSTNGSTVGEADEGRHRNHPLYSKGPEADGLYHCPFTSDPSCQHKPTKLKCNYDKFIDSHLKPFRCKIESCSKQEFSSTACLLRHEREAHGMHGHGERPHLCFYPGCERGIPGNGFPRRYNLFDHMKRVHDHKEEPHHDRSADQVPRKPASRKRKASPSGEESAAQRIKSQSAPAMSLPQEVYPVQLTAYSEHLHRHDQSVQRNMYSQWNNQKQLVEFQMNSLSSPDDQANLDRLSQNVEELRRLSHQARHG